MLANIIVGAIFLGIIVFGVYKSIKSMKNNTCPGCAGGCSKEKRSSCR
ncbi:MAG: FeoB-associated Cys-rich membrane protein [Bacillota bacterium]